MRSLSAVATLSGPIVLLGYVVGSFASARLRRDGAARRPSDHAVEAFAAIAVSAAAWAVIQEVSPGSGFSRIGYFSNQVLAAWHSVALWAGLAVVAGIVASVFRHFEGSDGIAPTAALLAVHYPWFLLGCLSVSGLALAWLRSPRAAQGAAIGALLPVAWLGWVLEWLPAWGLTPGPEATVWAMVATIVLGVRWWSDDQVIQRSLRDGGR